MSSKTAQIFISYIKSTIIILALLTCSNSFASDISEKVRSYISNIKSISVEFEQSDQSGKLSYGMLIIDKPYKFRCNYYSPFPIVIIGNKNYVSVYDYEMEHLSRISASENIFNFLLTDKVNFNDQFEILEEKDDGKNYIIKVKRIDLNKISEISFSKNSGEINSMVIFEDNNTIRLTFSNTVKITNAKKSLFIIQDPKIYGKPDRLSKKDLMKKFKIIY